MIQRIQTIYLMLSGIVSAVGANFLSLWKIGNIVVMAYSFKPFYLLTLTSATFSLIAIFLFKNRKLQFVFNRLNLFINLICLGLLAYRISTMDSLGNIRGGFGLVIPFASILFLVLANKNIKKDELLIKSMDRIR